MGGGILRLPGYKGQSEGSANLGGVIAVVCEQIGALPRPQGG